MQTLHSKFPFIYITPSSPTQNSLSTSYPAPNFLTTNSNTEIKFPLSKFPTSICSTALTLLQPEVPPLQAHSLQVPKLKVPPLQVPPLKLSQFHCIYLTPSSPTTSSLTTNSPTPSSHTLSSPAPSDLISASDSRSP